MKNYIHLLIFLSVLTMLPGCSFISDKKRNKKNYNSENSQNSGEQDFSGRLIEMIMGSGKTSTVLPLTANVLAQKDSMIVIVFPESLMPSMSSQISEQMGLAFGRPVEVVKIRRNFKYNSDKLTVLKSSVFRAYKEKRILIMSNSSIQSLFLLLAERLRDKKSSNTEIQLLKDIIEIFRKYALVLIDEVDLILDIMQAHRFSVGDKVFLEQEFIEAVVGLYRFIIKDEYLKNQIQIPFLGNKSKVPFRTKHYNSELKIKLIERLATNDAANKLFPKERFEHINRAYRKLDKDKLKSFLISSDLKFNNEYLNEIESVKFRDIIATMYSQIHTGLPLTLNRLMLVHYGIHPKKENEECINGKDCPKFFAIPYHSGTPAPNSRFGSDLEAANYSIQSHIELRDSVYMLRSVHERLKKSYPDANDSKKKLIDLEMKYYFPDLAEGQFQSLSHDQIDGYAIDINTSDDAAEIILELARRSIIKDLNIFKTQLSTNSFLYPQLFKTIIGVSGTLWNVNTFPSFYNKVHMSDTMEKTLFLVRTYSSKEVKLVKNTVGMSTEDKVQAFLSGSKSASIIDQDGLFRGVDNQLVAQEILNYNEDDCENVIFYDDEDMIQVLGSSGSVQSYDPLSLDREKTCAFWDIRHTTGSDLKIKLNGQAMMIIGKHSGLRDMMQGAWRLRGLETTGQVVNFGVTSEDWEIMTETIKQERGNFDDLDDVNKLIMYLILNETDKVSKQTFRSLKFALNTPLVKGLFDKLFAEETAPQRMRELYAMSSNIFETTRADFPHQRYGKPHVEMDSKDAAEQEMKNVLKSKTFKELVKSSIVEEEHSQNIMKSVLEDKIPLLRDTVLTQGQDDAEYSAEVEVEIELETEQEEEQEEEQELELEIYDLDPNMVKIPRWNWSKNNLFNDSFLQSELTRSDLSSTIDPSTTLLNPFMKFSEALKFDRKEKFAKYINQNIYVSQNFTPLYKLAGQNNAYRIYSLLQKEINQIMVTVNSTGEIKLYLVDREEILDIGKDLILNDSGTHKILIYDLGGGFTRYNKIVDDLHDKIGFQDSIINDEKFIRMLIQVKFATGRLSFEENEAPYLTEWLKQDPKFLGDFFYKTILKYRQFAREDFEDSIIDTTLNKLGVD